MEKISPLLYEIFRKGSRTYFHASRFFPREIRRDVFILYGFLRMVDDLVDRVPQDRDGFYSFRKTYESAGKGTFSGNPLIDDFLDLSRRKNFDPDWTQAFFLSMEMDLYKKEYSTLEECLGYIYGAAEVIGLFLCAVLNLPEEARHSATMLGRSLQFVNMIRDIGEDHEMGRRYLPLSGTNLLNLSFDEALRKPEEFRRFLRIQGALYLKWHKEAEKGYKYLPLTLLAPVKTASDLYSWTTKVIMKNPQVVFRKKVKPGRLRILWTYILNRSFRPTDS